MGKKIFWGKMSQGKMTFGEKCRSQGYYGKKMGQNAFWGKMLQGKMSWGKTSLGKIVVHPVWMDSFNYQGSKVTNIWPIWQRKSNNFS